jgi:hypothetical protein
MDTITTFPLRPDSRERDDAHFIIMRSTSWSFPVGDHDKERYDRLCTKQFLGDIVKHLREVSKVRSLNIWEANFLDRLGSAVPTS